MGIILFVVRFILILVAVIACWVFKDGLLLIAFGMLPTVVAWFIDNEQDKNTAKIVCYMNCLGMVIVEGKIFCSGATDWVTASWRAMSNPMNFIIIYSSAFLGWVFVFCMPHLVQSYFSMFYNRILTALVKERLRLLKKWGNELTLGPSILPTREKEIIATIHYIHNGNILKKQKKFLNTLSDDTQMQHIIQSSE